MERHIIGLWRNSSMKTFLIKPVVYLGNNNELLRWALPSSLLFDVTVAFFSVVLNAVAHQ